MDGILIAVAIASLVISTVSFCVLFFEGELKKEWKAYTIPFIIFSIVVIWMNLGAPHKSDIKYDVKSYPISILENSQVVKVNDNIININKLLGEVAQPNQVLEVSTPKSKWFGGIYWTFIKTEYKLIDKKEKK